MIAVCWSLLCLRVLAEPGDSRDRKRGEKLRKAMGGRGEEHRSLQRRLLPPLPSQRGGAGSERGDD